MDCLGITQKLIVNCMFYITFFNFSFVFFVFFSFLTKQTKKNFEKRKEKTKTEKMGKIIVIFWDY